MMLEYIWFGVLMTASTVLAWVYPGKQTEASSYGDDADTWLFASYGMAFMSLAISWDRTGATVLNWLLSALPQHGSPIALLTAYVLLGAACLLVAGGVPLAVVMLSHVMRDRATSKQPHVKES